MAFTAKDVSDLRAKTGIGMMECKKALTEADGNMDEAIKILREKGLKVADKKADRIAADGIVDILVDGTTAVMIEVNSETDFVAKNANFQEFVKGLLKTVLATRPADVDALMAVKYADSDDTVETVLKNKIFEIGEKLTIRRFVITEGILSTYIHMGGSIGVIVNAQAGNDSDEVKAVLKNVALQIAAMNPRYLDKDSVPASVIEEEKGILLTQLKNDEANAKKPENILEKIVLGKIGKFYDTNCLLEQEYVKDDSKRIKEYVADEAKALGVEITLKEFFRFEKGEGIEKRVDDLAAEVAKMTQK